MDQEIRKSNSSNRFLCIATFLPIRRWLDVIPFLRMSFRVERQLKQADGLISYDLRAELLKRHFWTLSVWKDRVSANAFVSLEAHAAAIEKFDKWAGTGAAFVHWNSSDSNIDWDEALRKLENPTFYYRD